MARRIMIITAGVLGVAVFIAFLAFGGREDPVLAPAGPEQRAAASPPTVTRADEPGPGRAESVDVLDAEPVTGARWSACADAIPEEPPPVLDGLGEGRTPPIVATLSTSGSAEHVLAGALLRPESETEAIRADIERALALDGDHPLVLWHADDLCGSGVGAPYCRSPGFLGRVGKSLESNAAVWMRRAVRNLERGRERAALENLGRAAVAPEYDHYWSQHIVLFDRALAVGGDLSIAQRITISVGLAAAIDGPGFGIFRTCLEMSISDSLWMDACTRLATRVAADSRTFLDRAISYGVLEDLYEKQGRDDAARRAAQKRSEIEKMLTLDRDRELVFVLDDRFSARWLDELAANGEIAAMEFASAEIERLKADPGYDPCALIVR